MERLTQKSINYCAEICRAQDCETYHGVRNDVCGDAAIYNRLAAYEDLEEQGRLVVLPCKIGDEVWCIKRFNRARKVVSAHVSEMYFSSEMRLVIVCYHAVRGELGKTVFLTREEAEKALEGVSDDA